MANFILGTRGSLLAVTQSTIIANQLKSYYPQHHFTLKTIKTQGDVVTDKALWQLEGKDFFTKELDDALNAKIVDFVVHSYKDLSTERPAQIKLAAITTRKFAHDVLLIKSETIRKIQKGTITHINLGTSSPRRQFLLSQQIKNFLPFGQKLQITCTNLRGNINTRIEKLRSGEFDIICLAFAGLERLANLEESYQKLETLLHDIEIKFLPLSIFPAAPAQGALAIECLHSHEELAGILNKLHCTETAKEVGLERDLFKTYGGGCHLALGVFAKKQTNNSIFISALGQVDHKTINVCKMIPHPSFPNLVGNEPIFIGLTPQRLKEHHLPENYFSDEAKVIQPLDTPHPQEINTANFFISSEHCINTFNNYVPFDKPTLLWCSGTVVHQKLSALGYWVHGDNDSMGKIHLHNIQHSSLDKLLLKNKPILELSFQMTSLQQKNIWGTYTSRHEKKLCNEQFIDKLKRCSLFFWTSFRQFQFYSENFPEILTPTCSHFCGIGKTYTQFKEHNLINITAIPNIDFFLNLIKNHNSIRIPNESQ